MCPFRRQRWNRLRGHLRERRPRPGRPSVPPTGNCRERSRLVDQAVHKPRTSAGCSSMLHCPHCRRWHRVAATNSTGTEYTRLDAVLGAPWRPVLRWPNWHAEPASRRKTPGHKLDDHRHRRGAPSLGIEAGAGSPGSALNSHSRRAGHFYAVDGLSYHRRRGRAPHTADTAAPATARTCPRLVADVSPRNPRAVLTAAIYQTDTGRELRVGLSHQSDSLGTVPQG